MQFVIEYRVTTAGEYAKYTRYKAFDMPPHSLPLCTGHLPSALGARTWLYNVYIGPTLGAMGIATCTAIVSGVALKQLVKGVEGKEGV